jgi:hypothetical protein
MSAGQPQPLPQQPPQYVHQQSTQRLSGGGGGGGQDGGGGGGRGGESPPDGVAAELRTDERLKATLHGLVLVIPLAVLIFGEALHHRESEIELPILKLKLTVQSLVPVFLMVIAYMLHRAIRYARIVLWNIVDAPRQLTETSKIVLDDTEAYKMNSSYYEVLDPMAAAVMPTPLAGRRLSWTGLAMASFNVIRSLVMYGVIFLILAFTALYVSQEVLSIVGPLSLDNIKPRWPSDATKATNNLILTLSVFLLFLAWTNVAMTVVLAAWGLLRGGAKLLWRSFLSEPLRWLLRLLLAAGTRTREWRRDRLFKKETAAYERCKQKFLATSPAVAEFRSRLSLFEAVETMRSRLETINRHFGKSIHGNYVGENDTIWLETLPRMGICLDRLAILAERAPADFLSGDWRKLKEGAEQILDAYEASPDEALSKGQKPALTPAEQQDAIKAIQARRAVIPSQKVQIDALFSVLRNALDKVIDPNADFMKLAEKTKSYFALSALDAAGFAEPAPMPVTSDTGVIARVFALLERAGRSPSAKDRRRLADRS